MMQQPGSGVAPQQMPADQQYQQQPPQQWMMMQQQQQPVPPPSGWTPPPVPPPSQYGVPQPVAQGAASADSSEIRSLWIGDLQQWMDENYVFSIFASTGEVTYIYLTCHIFVLTTCASLLRCSYQGLILGNWFCLFGCKINHFLLFLVHNVCAPIFFAGDLEEIIRKERGGCFHEKVMCLCRLIVS